MRKGGLSMEIKDVKCLRKIMAKERELRKSIVDSIQLNLSDLVLPLHQLLADYKFDVEKITEDKFPKREWSVEVNDETKFEVAVFKLGQISSWDADEKMASLKFLPADVHEVPAGLNKSKKKLPGMYFVSGSPVEPGEDYTTFVAIKVEGEK